MKFSILAEYFSRLDEADSRLVMTEVLADLYRGADLDEVEMVVNLSLGQLKPKFDRLDFSLADKMVVRAMAQSFSRSVEEVTKAYKEIGDVGDVVENLKSQTSKNQNEIQKSRMSVGEVYKELVKIAEEGGQGSQERKIKGLADLLKDLDGLSGKYVVRIVLGKLRMGFSDMTILDALSWMEAGDKTLRKNLENAYQLNPDVGKLVKRVKEKGVKKACAEVEIELGVPVVPALAQRLKTADEMIEKMGEVGVEPKFDGTRVQIHFSRNEFGATSHKPQATSFSDSFFGEENQKKGTVRTFTRNLDETTQMFPEIASLGKWVEAEELILDSEAVGYDPETGEMLPFQQTIKRKRKHGIKQAAKDIPLTFWVFDVLYKDGKSLIKEPFNKRREVLEKVVRKGTELIKVDELIRTNKPKDLRKKHGEYLEQGLEGAVVKKWDGVYEPGRRGWSWVKFKENETSKAKLSDTVDCLVMGTYVGKGKRTKFGVGAFLVGVRGEQVDSPGSPGCKPSPLGVDTDDEKRKISNLLPRREAGKTQTSNESQAQNSKSKTKSGASGGFVEGKFFTISKVGTGLTDEQWGELKTRSKKHESRIKPKEYVVDKNLVPDKWLAPGLVVEIAADEITKSPIHSAGLALRFPRLIRFRVDKSAEQTTSVNELENIK